MLTAAEVAERAGRRTANPSDLLRNWVKAKRVFALTERPRRLYPAFQFGPDGNPNEALRPLLRVLGGTLDGWALAIWFTLPNAELDGWATPLDTMARDPDAVVRAAMSERPAVSF